MNKTILPTSLSACVAFLLMLGLLSACSSERPTYRGGGVSSDGGYYKVGRPYQVKGKTYYPTENYTYDETGIASWYGSDFHNKRTANGELYNMNELTAAHKTLPMPSLARVTNLENGRAIVVRINDRGPFVQSRIIDLSRRSAQLLGFINQGTAKVRVQVLADESRAIAEAMRTYGTAPRDVPQPVTVASADNGQSIASTPVDIEPVIIEAKPAKPVLQPISIETVKPVPTYTQMPVTGPNDIYVQAGAFTKIDNAMRLKDKLETIGQVQIVEALVKGVLYYRVRVGPVSTVAQADMLLSQVLGSGVDGARIIVN